MVQEASDKKCGKSLQFIIFKRKQPERNVTFFLMLWSRTVNKSIFLKKIIDKTYKEILQWLKVICKTAIYLSQVKSSINRGLKI